MRGLKQLFFWIICQNSSHVDIYYILSIKLFIIFRQFSKSGQVCFSFNLSVVFKQTKVLVKFLRFWNNLWCFNNKNTSKITMRYWLIYASKQNLWFETNRSNVSKYFHPAFFKFWTLYINHLQRKRPKRLQKLCPFARWNQKLQRICHVVTAVLLSIFPFKTKDFNQKKTIDGQIFT